MTTFYQTTTIDGPAGALELAIRAPSIEAPEANDHPATPRALAIICHPHPLFGGSMQNKVVTTLERVFRERGCVTIRFNFRGVGKSAGSFDHGVGEAQDLQAVYDYARAYFPDLPLELSGFSFGSFVAASMANSLQAELLLSIAPPVLSWDFSSIDPTMPWTIVQGAEDEVVAPDAVYQYAEQHPRKPTLVRMPGGHFFHGLLLELREKLLASLATQ